MRKTLKNNPGFKILGFDPGTKRVGYGVVSSRGKRLVLLGHGRFFERESPSLLALRKQAKSIFAKYSPTHVAIESLFFGRNRSSALAVSQARGVLCLVSQEAGVPILEVTPQTVKRMVTGYGRADKEAVRHMVQLYFEIKEKSLTPDETDALAIALASLLHLQSRKLQTPN